MRFAGFSFIRSLPPCTPARDWYSGAAVHFFQMREGPSRGRERGAFSFIKCNLDQAYVAHVEWFEQKCRVGVYGLIYQELSVQR